MKVKVFLSTAGQGARARMKHRALLSFLEGLRLEGVDAEPVERTGYSSCDVAVMFGGHRQAASSRASKDTRDVVFGSHHGCFVLLETPLLGRRVYQRSKMMSRVRKLLKLGSRTYSDAYEYFRVGVDGTLADDGEFCNRDSSSERWQMLSRRLNLNVQAYRQTGKHVLLVGQNPGDASLRGLNIFTWLEESIAEIRQFTDRPVLVRPHPVTDPRLMQVFERQFSALPQGVSLDFPPRRPIRACLQDCWAIVAYSSNATIDALIDGIPAISLNSANMAWPVSDHSLASIERPSLFAREQWLYDLACAQWSADEMRSGIVWRHIREVITERCARKFTLAGRAADTRVERAPRPPLPNDYVCWPNWT